MQRERVSTQNVRNQFTNDDSDDGYEKDYNNVGDDDDDDDDDDVNDVNKRENEGARNELKSWITAAGKNKFCNFCNSD